MKICWDNLEKVRLTREGNFSINGQTSIEIDFCKTCGDPYLTRKCAPSCFCSRTCSISGKYNPFFGKAHTLENRKGFSDRAKHRRGSLNPNYKGGAQNKILANDIDNCITLCKECHKLVHKQHGCRYVDLKCRRGK